MLYYTSYLFISNRSERDGANILGVYYGDNRGLAACFCYYTLKCMQGFGAGARRPFFKGAGVRIGVGSGAGAKISKRTELALEPKLICPSFN